MQEPAAHRRSVTTRIMVINSSVGLDQAFANSWSDLRCDFLLRSD